MKTRSDKPKPMTRRILSVFLWTLFILALAFALLWYMSQPPEQAHEPRWDESNVGLDITAEERKLEQQLPGLKQSRVEAAAEERRQQEREEQIRQEERQKAQEEAEALAAEQAKAEAEAQAKAEAEEQEAGFDKQLADYETAIYYFRQDYTAQLDFLNMQVDTVKMDPSYMDTMDFAVSMDEGSRALYDLHTNFMSVDPPPAYADFHIMYGDAIRMTADAISKINEGVMYYDQALIDEGILDLGMAINFLGRAEQAAPVF